MKYRSLICLLIATLFSASCEKENGTAVHSRYIRFNASVNAALEYEVKSTNAGEGKFAEGTHNMGLWLCNPNNSPILPEFANTKVEYTVNPDNSESWKFYYDGDRYWENAIPVDDAREINIYSYYPYDKNVEDITAIPFSSGTKNYFYSEPVKFTEEVTDADEVTVELKYKPIMTCIEVAVMADVDGAVALNGMVLTDMSGENIATKGTYNAITGEVKASAEDKKESLVFTADKPLMLTTDKNTPKVSFIIPKYLNYNANFKLSFKFNGIEGLSEYVIPNKITAETGGYFMEGKKYIITLQLNDAMKFKTVSFVTLDDWNQAEVVEPDDIVIK